MPIDLVHNDTVSGQKVTRQVGGVTERARCCAQYLSIETVMGKRNLALHI